MWLNDIVLYISFIIFGLSSCGVSKYADKYVKSSCPPQYVQQWNHRNVSAHLKSWWRSFQYTSRESNLKAFYFDRKSNEFYPEPSDSTVNTVFRWSDVGRDTVTWQVFDSEVDSGLLYGNVSLNFTGSDIIYIYPDFKTALKGRFENGKFIRGIEAVITAERCYYGIKQIKTKYKNVDQIWEADDPEMWSAGKTPTIMDPHERKSVFVSNSTIAGADEGLFAKRDFQPGDLISYYGGVKGLSGVNEIQNSGSNLTADDMHYKTSCQFQLSHNAPESWNIPEGQFYDAPPFYRDLKNYRHTLGHKVNHKFPGHTNAGFSEMMHPFHGPIGCILADKSIKRGEEIFVSYNIEVPDGPDWYRQQWQELYDQGLIFDDTALSLSDIK